MSVRYGERWAQGLILQWMNQIIRGQKFPFKRADQEVQIKTIKGVVKYPGIVIWNGTGEKAACLIELKTPMTSAYDEELVGDALKKSIDAGIPFFATWNINKLVLWETFRLGTTLLERRIPKGKPTIKSNISGFYVQVRGEEVYRSWDQDEVKFVYFAALTGASYVKLPLDKQAIKAAVKTFEKDYNKLKEEANDLLLTLIPDAKMRRKIESEFWKNYLLPIR